MHYLIIMFGVHGSLIYHTDHKVVTAAKSVKTGTLNLIKVLTLTIFIRIITIFRVFVKQGPNLVRAKVNVLHYPERCPNANAL
jgi:hypothetical protein